MEKTSKAVLAHRVGECIKAARRASGLSRERVARSAGMTGRELAGYEHGKNLPCNSDLRALAGACGLEASELLPTEISDSLPEEL